MIQPPFQQFRVLFDSLIKTLPRSICIGLLGPHDTYFPLKPILIQNGMNRIAELCKQYLRNRYPDSLPEVEDFIASVERGGNDRGISPWERLIDATNISDELLWPLEVKFQSWLKQHPRGS
jgi:hypothetical protein